MQAPRAFPRERAAARRPVAEWARGLRQRVAMEQARREVAKAPAARRSPAVFQLARAVVVRPRVALAMAGWLARDPWVWTLVARQALLFQQASAAQQRLSPWFFQVRVAQAQEASGRWLPVQEQRPLGRMQQGAQAQAALRHRKQYPRQSRSAPPALSSAAHSNATAARRRWQHRRNLPGPPGRAASRLRPRPVRPR